MRILALHRKPVHTASNGEEVRVVQTMEYLAQSHDTLLALPGGKKPPGAAFDTCNIDSLLSYPVARIHLWWGAFIYGTKNPYDYFISWQVRRSLNIDGTFDVVLCQAPQLFTASVQLAERFDAKLVIDQHNAWHRLVDQHLADRDAPLLFRDRVIRNLHSFEQYAINQADAVVFQSSDDADHYTISDDTTVRVIPNGTDVTALKSVQTSDEVAIKYDLTRNIDRCIFLGSYDYSPNHMAAEFIDASLAPQLPDVEFLLAGRSPPETSSPNVKPLGFVDKLPDILSLADVALCPLFSGSGTKLKMLDYLAAGLPVVTTPVGAQGLPLKDGKNAVIASNTEEFATAIEHLLDAPSFAAKLRSNGQMLAENYDWHSLLQQYEVVITNG